MANFLIYILSAIVLHPIHISKCQMEVNAESKAIEITLHVYIDDLQEIIESQGHPALHLATAKELKGADQLIHAYLSEHLMILNGENQARFRWVGKEQSDDLLAFYCYLETEEIDESKGLAIQFSVLQDLYDDQKNILNVKRSNGDEEYFLCKKGDNIAKIN